MIHRARLISLHCKALQSHKMDQALQSGPSKKILTIGYICKKDAPGSCSCASPFLRVFLKGHIEMCSALYASSLTYTKMFKCKCVIRASSVLHVYCARVARCYDANKCDPRAAPCPPSQLSRGSSRYLSVMESSTRGSRKRSQG